VNVAASAEKRTIGFKTEAGEVDCLFSTPVVGACLCGAWRVCEGLMHPFQRQTSG